MALFLNSQHEITPEVFSAIQDAKKAGVKIVIATGRPISGVRAILEQLQLTELGDYVITFNGGLVQDVATGEDIVKDTLTYDDYLDIELGRTQTQSAHACQHQTRHVYCQPKYWKIHHLRSNVGQLSCLLSNTRRNGRQGNYQGDDGRWAWKPWRRHPQLTNRPDREIQRCQPAFA